MGPSGSGKSTLLNLIAGLDRPTAGTVTVAGQRIDTLGEGALARFRARHVGIIFQFFNLLDDLTVEDNVLLPAQLAGRVAAAGAGAGRRAAGPAGHRGAPRRLPGPAVRRAAAAGGDRPRAGQLARSCCSPTSRPARWTPPPARRSAGCSASSTRPGRRWCSSPTTRRWPQRYAARTVANGGWPGRRPADASGAGGTPARQAGDQRDAAGSARQDRHRRAAAAQGAVGGDRAWCCLSPPRRPPSAWRCSPPSNGPFDHAFAAQHGADLTVTVNAARASAAQLAATRTRRGHRAGRAVRRGHGADPVPGPAVRAVHPGGRAAPGGPVDDLVLNAGHWPDGPGQVVAGAALRPRRPTTAR